MNKLFVHLYDWTLQVIPLMQYGATRKPQRSPEGGNLLPVMLGGLLLAFGIAISIWFVRNTLRPSYNQAPLYKETAKGVIIASCTIATLAGYFLAQVSPTGIIFGIALGLVVGMGISR